MTLALDLTVGWEFDLVVCLPMLALAILGMVLWARRYGGWR